MPPTKSNSRTRVIGTTRRILRIVVALPLTVGQVFPEWDPLLMKARPQPVPYLFSAVLFNGQNPP